VLFHEEDFIQGIPHYQVLFEAIRENVFENNREFIKFLKHYNELPATRGKLRDYLSKLEEMCDSNQRKFKQDDELVTKMAQGSKQNALFVTQTDPARGLGGEVGWKFDNKTHKDVLKQ